jgi:hypothetical protein
MFIVFSIHVLSSAMSIPDEDWMALVVDVIEGGNGVEGCAGMNSNTVLVDVLAGITGVSSSSMYYVTVECFVLSLNVYVRLKVNEGSLCSLFFLFMYFLQR